MSEDAANPTMKKFGCIDSSLCFRINREPEIALASPASGLSPAIPKPIDRPD
jgi:hypothetical protein